MIYRYYSIEKLIQKGKALIIYGPRRSGKTTLLVDYLKHTTLTYKLDSGDSIELQQLLGSSDVSRIIQYAEGYDIIAIDEAQQIPHIGTGLKILVDHLPQLAIIATGSSSFDLSQQVGEPLTGRKKTVTLFPFAQIELAKHYNAFELQQRMDEFMIFGSYPEVVIAKSRKEKIRILTELVNSYLLKDVLSMERIKGSKQLLDMLKLLAFQVGSEVSLNEIATHVRMDVKTVGRYLDILEKGFVLKRLGGLSRNLRKEVYQKAKYYFLDMGVRNALIAQFNPISSRNDLGALFENFVLMERWKYNEYTQRVGAVEERSGKLFGYEIKSSAKARSVAPKDWVSTYSNGRYKVITPKNYLSFIGVK